MPWNWLFNTHNRPCKHSSKLQQSILFTPIRCLDVRQDWQAIYILLRRDEGSCKPCEVDRSAYYEQWHSLETQHQGPPSTVSNHLITAAHHCKAMRCDAMQCSAMQCRAMQCNAMQCNTIQCNAMRCNAISSDLWEKSSWQILLHPRRRTITAPREVPRFGVSFLICTACRQAKLHHIIT